MSSGKECLSFSVKRGDKEMVELLVAHGANLDHQDQWGWTALMYAAAASFDEIVEILVKAGAKTNVKNLWGETAYSIAQDLGHTEVLAKIPADSSPVVFAQANLKVIGDEYTNLFKKFEHVNAGPLLGRLLLLFFLSRSSCRGLFA